MPGRNLCWIGSDGLGQYPDLDVCPECGKEIVSILNYYNNDGKHKPDSEIDAKYFLDRFWNTSHEADGSRVCGLCFTPLSVSLTNYGAKEELDHFERCPIDGVEDWRSWLDVLEALNYTGADRELVKRSINITNAGN